MYMAGEFWRLTRQVWSVRIAWGLSTLFGIGAILWSMVSVNLLLFFGCLAAFVMVAIWAIVTIRCPACRTKLLWRAVRHEGVSSWGESLAVLDRCPVCGFSGSPDLSKRDESAE